MKEIERVEERVAYRNQFVTVFDDDVCFPSGDRGTYLRIEHEGGQPGVVVVPSYAGRLGLVLTFRYPIGEFQWAFPRGFAHSDDIEVSARAELREELGATAETYELLGYVTPDSGLQSTRVAILHAHVAQVSERTDHAEVAETRWLTLEELFRLVDEGEIQDAFTLSALLLLTRRGDDRAPG